jgi:hypothetical protein
MPLDSSRSIDIPATPILLASYDLAAALESGDTTRALEAACLLSQLAGAVIDELGGECNSWPSLVQSARKRCIDSWAKKLVTEDTEQK